MSGSGPGAADAATSEQGDAAASEKSESGAAKKQGPATKLAIFTRTVMATLILAAAGAIGAGLGQLALSPSRGTGSAAPAATASGQTLSGVLPKTGDISVQGGTQASYIDVPDPSDSRNLIMQRCVSGNVAFDCYDLDAALSGNIYDNQEWQIASTELGNGTVYVATITSEFPGSWVYPIPVSGAAGQYLSDLNVSQGQDVGLVPVSDDDLSTADPTGHQGQYWVLRYQSTGQWTLSPWLAPGECLSAPGGSRLELEPCQSNDDSDQLWTVGLRQAESVHVTWPLQGNSRDLRGTSFGLRVFF
jgi:hypothetical protein